MISVNTIKKGSIVGSVGPVMPGYWKLPEESREVLTKDGWFKTGDLGHLDKQGCLFISAGRKKDLIIRAGENVAPLAIENVLLNHPAQKPDRKNFKTKLREEVRAALNPS